MKKRTILIIVVAILIGLILALFIFNRIQSNESSATLIPVSKAVMKTISPEAGLGEDAKNIYEKLMADADEEDRLVYEFNKEHAANVQVQEIDNTDNEITLEITAPNLKKIIETILAENKDVLKEYSDSQAKSNFLKKKIIEAVKSGEFETITNTVKVQYRNDENGDLEIIETDEYLNAIYGGLQEMYMEYSSKIEDMLTNEMDGD